MDFSCPAWARSGCGRLALVVNISVSGSGGVGVPLVSVSEHLLPSFATAGSQLHTLLCHDV